ncbi:MAG: polysaccharide biosynthesis tyrosine autokinase [Chloroflexota bacterium]|nr:polysaccharide biosynthesis tyrosine autokinase [Chloroflexota bacterium]
MRSSLSFVRRWWLLLLLAPILAGVVGYEVVRRIPSVYEATLTILVQTPATTSAGSADVQSAQALADTLAEQLRTRPILSHAAAQLGVTGLTGRDLEPLVQTRRLANTALVRLSIQNTDPTLAAQIANTVAGVLINTNSELEAARYASARDNLGQMINQLQSDADARNRELSDLRDQPASPERDARIAQLQDELARLRTLEDTTLRGMQDLQISHARSTAALTVVDPAVPPQNPIRPNRPLTTLMSIVAGLVAGLGVALTAEYLDDRLRDPASVSSALGLPTLGVLPLSAPGKLTDSTNEHLAAGFRSLRSNLLFVLGAQSTQFIVVASTSPGDGKSTVASNLAVCLAETDRRVILVDANLHQPAQMRFFRVPNERGLANLLADEPVPPSLVLKPTSAPNLQLLTAGTSHDEPSALLSSRRLGGVLRELGGLCDVVVIDTPSLLVGPDAAILSLYAHVVLFVLHAGHSRQHRVEPALAMLRGSAAPIIGAILNRMSDPSPHAGSAHWDLEPPSPANHGLNGSAAYDTSKLERTPSPRL